MMDESRKLTILQVHNFYQIPGGEDTVVANEKAMLEHHGHRVVQYFRSNTELKTLPLWKKLLLPVTTVFNPKTFRDVRRLIRQEHIDIVHVHNTLNLISPSVYYAALAEGVPVVQTMHNFRLLCPGAVFYRDGHICEDCVTKGLGCALKHKCYRGSRLQTLACVLSTVIHRMTGIYGKLHYICLTEFNRDKLLTLPQIRAERVFIKPNFSGEMGEKPNFSGRKKQFLYVGRLEEIKGTRTLLEAWKRVCAQSDARLILCGSGPIEDWCRSYVDKERLPNVELKGFVPHEEVFRLLEESLALVFPTQVYEGFGVTIPEAFSRGTPVIGSNLGNTASLIDDGCTGVLFTPGSAEDLAAKMLGLTEAHASEMGANAYEFCRKRYSAEENYRLLTKIYSEVLRT